MSSEATPVPAIERNWWLRAPAVLVAPRAVFVSLRDTSPEAVEARTEPITAIVGLAGLAAPSVRDHFRGIERVDSFVVDPHKWLFAPFDCAALLYRDPAAARRAHAQHAPYLDPIRANEAWTVDSNGQDRPGAICATKTNCLRNLLSRVVRRRCAVGQPG